MALPASGTLAMSTIASSVGTVSPHSMNNLTRLTAVGSNASTFKSSNFYSWPDGGYKNGSPAILFDFGLNANYSNSGSTVSDRSGNGRNGTFVTGTGNGTAATIYHVSKANEGTPPDPKVSAIVVEDPDVPSHL